VITGSDHETFRVVLFEEVDDSLHGSVIGKHLMDLSSRIVVVTSMVNSASLDHDEETLVTVLCSIAESTKSSLGHFFEGWVLVVNVSAIDFEGNVGGCEQSKQRKLDRRAEIVKFLTGANIVPIVFIRLLNQIPAVGSAAASSGVGQKVASSSTKNQIDVSAQRTVANELLSNLIFHSAGSDMRDEACWSSVGDAGGDNESSGIASPLCSLHDTATGSVVGGDADSAVVGLVATAEGSGTSSTVRDKTIAASRATVSDQVLVQDQGMVPRQGVDILVEASGQSQRGWTHPIRNHEYKVSLSGGSVAMFLGCCL
jgi:hypothetical protein